MIYRRKQGFGAPMEEWFREGDFGRRCLAAFERSALTKDGFFDNDYFRLLKDQMQRIGRPQLPALDRDERRALARVVGGRPGGLFLRWGAFVRGGPPRERGVFPHHCRRGSGGGFPGGGCVHPACGSVDHRHRHSGMWFFWSQYSYLSALSWWADNAQNLQARTPGARPDYDLTTLAWKVIPARVRGEAQGRMTIVTSSEPFGYQAFANISTAGAVAVDLQFDLNVEAGGVTIGLVQGGKWIAINSTQKPGAFADSNSAQLGYRRSLTVMIANDNPAGESRLTVKSLRLFLRK